MHRRIRFARPEDAPALEQIENEADRLFDERFRPETWPPAPTGAERLAEPGFLLVVDGDDGGPVGFAHVLERDGVCHLEQLSVTPGFARQGLGRALVEAAKDEARTRGHEAISLRTYADVPWNAPFYATAGFVEVAPSTPFDDGPVATEARLGLDRYGRRVQMVASLREADAPNPHR